MKFWIKIGMILILVLLTTSCGVQSLDDFEEEGKGVMRSLIQELQNIHNREQLLNASPKLQKKFEDLVSIMILAMEFREKHVEIIKDKQFSRQQETSDQLRSELNRLYRLEGGRQIIEKCQEKALLRLDAFEKKRAKSVGESSYSHEK